MATIAEVLALAMQYHRAGDLRQAEQLCLQVLQAEPGNADALHLLGVIAHQAGRPEMAVEQIGRAIASDPGRATFHNSLGVALWARGQLPEAATSFQKSLRLEPGSADVWLNFGRVLRILGWLEQAESSYQQALQLRPNDISGHVYLGDVRRARRKFDEAVDSYRLALQLQPDHAEAYNGLGNALWSLDRRAEATACFRQALALKPDPAVAHNNLGNALAEQGQFSEAVAHLRRALQLRPDYAEACKNLGVVFATAGQLDEALACYEQALRILPAYAEAHGARAMVWLLQGNYAQGWPEYEWRWQDNQLPRRTFVQPQWDGSALGGRTILLHAEQGFGDMLQFVRYAPLVKGRGGRVVLECPPPLRPLLASCAGIDELVPAGGALPAFDVHAALLSLPGILKTDLATVPADVPYLRADPALVERWRAELSPLRGLKVGIAWQGSPRHDQSRRRAIPLEHFLTLRRLGGVRLFSLQKGSGVEQLQPFAEQGLITDLGSQLDEGTGAFMETAAVMKNLDLVVSSDTSVAHLAGALGVPVWLALWNPPEWRWLLGREDSPWYPTMRLFRQRQAGDWDDVFQRMADALQELVAARLAPERLAAR